ncbi:putative transcription regulator GNAT family [Dioscorea sansibarensis]
MEEKITLRPFTISDADDYMVWASDDKVSHFCSWDTYTDKNTLIDYIEKTVLPHPWFRAICLNGRPVGAISFMPGTGNDSCKGELGYVLASEQWGKGVMTKAVKLAVKSVFEEMERLERVEALVDVENKGSLKVLEKVGFLKEGVLRKYFVLKGRTRDMVMFSFLSSDTMHE